MAHRDFVTIVSTQDEAGHPRGLAVLKGREKKTVVAFLQSIPEPLRATIEQACPDLYEGFANAVKEVLPHVKRVADSFHVAKLSRAAVEDLRKQEMNALKQTLPKEEYARLKGVLWRLRRNFADLSEADKQLLERLFDHSPRLRQAHALREQVTTILGQKLSKEAAPRALRAWTEEVKRSGLNCFDTFLGTLENWLDEITNSFISRRSSGWVEGLNNKIKVLKRRSYGLTNISNLFRRIWLDLNGATAFA
jgi:transposase